MKSAVCAVARNENAYLLEWIDYHLNLGFDKIFLYDNNNPGDDSVYVLLASYIADQKVEVIDYRGRKNFQLAAYNECYKNNGCLFDWIAFIDLDEFITFGPEAETDQINVFLKEFDSFDVIEINWMVYNDNGKILKEEGGVIERFPEPANLSHPINKHVKSVVRTNRPLTFVRNPHCVDGDLRIADDSMNVILKSEPFKEPSYKRLYIRHYNTKTLEEFILCKIHRGAADSDVNSWRYNLYLYYDLNIRTWEKRRFERKMCPLSVVVKTDIAMFFKYIGLKKLASSIRM